MHVGFFCSALCRRSLLRAPRDNSVGVLYAQQHVLHAWICSPDRSVVPDLWCGALFAVGTSALVPSKTRLRLRTLCLHPYVLPTACWRKLRAVESAALAWSTLRRSFLLQTRRRLRLCMSAFFVLHCVGRSSLRRPETTASECYMPQQHVLHAWICSPDRSVVPRLVVWRALCRWDKPASSQARRGYVGVLCVCTRTLSRPLVGKSFERLSLPRSLGRRFGDLFCFRPDVD